MSGAVSTDRTSGVEEAVWTTRRFSVPLPGQFDEVIGRFESFVTSYPHEEFAAMVERGSSWQEILERTNVLAPSGFLLYWKNDVRAIMSAAGDGQPCVAYLMGNHTIAERMFRFDGRVMNYASLRVEFTADHEGSVWFTFDQPSAQFASFGIPAVAAVGTDLDRKLCAIVERLGGIAPPRLCTAA
jgi:hypothetical protein